MTWIPYQIKNVCMLSSQTSGLEVERSTVVLGESLLLHPPGPVRGDEAAPAHQVEVASGAGVHHLLLHHSPGRLLAGLHLHTLQAPPHLEALLHHPDLLLLLLAVVLDVFPQTAGVCVPLEAARHLALVRLLKIVGQHWTPI